MDKKSVIEELSSIYEEGNFLKELILKIDDLNKAAFKIVFEEGIDSLSFSLEDIDR